MDVMKTEIVNVALDSLRRTARIGGLWVEATEAGLDGQLVLSVENQPVKFNVIIRKELRNHHLLQVEKDAKRFSPLMIVAEYLFPKVKDALREHNLAYLEANGNVFFNEAGRYFFIDTQSRRQVKEDKGNRAFTKTGLKVLFHYLIDPGLLNLPHREIAAIARVAHGNIAYVHNGLKDYGFLLKVQSQELKLIKKKELFEKWMVAYQESLQPSLNMGRFRFSNESFFSNWSAIKLDEETTWWGGESAASLMTNYLRPGLLTLYTLKSREELLREFRLIPDKDGNVVIYKAFGDMQGVKVNNCVHPLLVYADLMNANDNRCRETAQLIWNQYLEHEF